MRKILERLWNEPAYFTSAVAAVAVTILQVVELPDAVAIPLSIIAILAGGHATRARVTPLRR